MLNNRKQIVTFLRPLSGNILSKNFLFNTDNLQDDCYRFATVPCFFGYFLQRNLSLALRIDADNNFDAAAGGAYNTTVHLRLWL